MSSLLPLITDNFSSATSSSKDGRLRCVHSILITLTQQCQAKKPNAIPNADVTPKLSLSFGGFQRDKSDIAYQTELTTLRNLIHLTIADVLISTKEISAKCRATASDLLTAFCLCYPPPVGAASSMALAQSSPLAPKKFQIPKLKDQVREFFFLMSCW
jgi:hypothetical protein